MSKIQERFPTTISPKTINLKIRSKQLEYQNYYKETLGKYPFVWYNSYQIEPKAIQFFELSFTDNIPSLKLHFYDKVNMIKDKTFPIEDTTITVFISSRSKGVKPIFLEFKIVDFSTNRELNICFAVLNVKTLYLKQFKSYPNKTSYKLYEQLSKDLGLGFYSNLENTDDKMTWINTGQKVYEFMNKVLDHTYLSDQSFITGYIDFYYNYVFVDLQKELSRDIMEDAGSSNTGVANSVNVADKEIVSKLVLTNDLSAKQSNYFFDSYKVINNSHRVSISKGYESVVKYYDHLSKSYLPFNLKSFKDNDDYKIALNESFGDKKFTKQNLDFVYEGKFDSDNVHKNFLYAKIQNDRNLLDLEKIGLEISLPTPNFNYYKFQKVNVILSNQAANIQQTHINKRLSGEWMVTDIKYRISDNRFKQIINLVRRDLSKAEGEVRA
jgi:hypothetical protein